MQGEINNFRSSEFLMSLPWRVKEGAENFYQKAREFWENKGLTTWGDVKAFQGGGKLSIPEGLRVEAEDVKYLSEGRPFFMVIPAREGKDSFEDNRVMHIPTEKITEKRRFDANLAAYRKSVGQYVAGEWVKAGNKGIIPIPVALSTDQFEVEKGKKRYATITGFIRNMESLGNSGPAEGIHVLDIKKLPLSEIPNLMNALDAVHVPSDNFLKWVRDEKEIIPSESWMHPDNPECAFRGREWWLNPEREKKQLEQNEKWNDRLEELMEIAKGDKNPQNKEKIQRVMNGYFKNDDLYSRLENMIRNNQKLYRPQNGKPVTGEENLEGKMVVVNGVLTPSNIHRKLNSQTGRTDYLVTSGDRSQLYGLRGQMVDFLVASAAASPDHQKAIIKNFQDRYPDLSERRGLAMHVLYRCISEIPWYVGKGRMVEARHLAKLSSDILGENNWSGVWKGVTSKLE